MATDLTQLKKILDNESLLEEEKKMWMRMGMYIPNGTKAINGYTRGTIYDAAGNQGDIQSTVAKNLRNTIIDWWQVEKVKPRSEEKREVKQPGALDELENRNGT